MVLNNVNRSSFSRIRYNLYSRPQLIHTGICVMQMPLFQTKCVYHDHTKRTRLGLLSLLALLIQQYLNVALIYVINVVSRLPWTIKDTKPNTLGLHIEWSDSSSILSKAQRVKDKCLFLVSKYLNHSLKLLKRLQCWRLFYRHKMKIPWESN